MADLIDVMNALVGIAAGAAYPNGPAQPSLLGAGVNIRCFAGWPDPNTLQSDLGAGNPNVSVYPLPTERNVTRYPLEWQDGTINAPSLTLTVSNGNTVTVGGAVKAGEAAVVTLNGTPYAYGVLATDTLASIAAALAALMPHATAVSTVITIVDAGELTVGVSVQGTSLMEIKRQERLFQITVWAPDYQSRDTLSAAVDLALAQIPRLTMPDGSSARLIYHHSPMTDMQQLKKLYRRDLIYSVEYATVLSQTGQTIQAPVVGISTGPTGMIPVLVPTAPTGVLLTESGGGLLLETGGGYLTP